MAAADPAGRQKFWFNGLPYQGVARGGSDPLGLKFWFNGRPVTTVIPGGLAVFFLRPDADSRMDGWRNEADGTVLYTSVDESTPNDSDYVKSALNPVVTDKFRVRLSNPATATAQPAKVRYRYKKLGSGIVDINVKLVQGPIVADAGTTIASWDHLNIADSFVTTAQTLTQEEFDAITDFNDLFVEIFADTN